MMKKTILIFFALIGLLACSSSGTEVQGQTSDPDTSDSPSPNVDRWNIPIAEVFDGGPGRDGIPALTDPIFVSAEDVQLIQDDDLILGFKNGSDIRAYQHLVLDWHEIVNDDVSGVNLAVTYCPLTGTGIGWSREIGGNTTTFGVSGLLYQTNLIPFDRESNSNWSQILNEAVNGSLIGTEAELVLPLVEMEWGAWKAMYPETKILSFNTGFQRSYGVYPYLDYKTNNDAFLFPVPKDNRLPSKERVLAVVENENALAFRFEDFTGGALYRESHQGRQFLIAGNLKFMLAFDISGPMSNLEFTYIHDGSALLLEDNEGNRWTVMGEAVSGPRVGAKLPAATSFMGYWFSIPAFYPTRIFNP